MGVMSPASGYGPGVVLLAPGAAAEPAGHAAYLVDEGYVVNALATDSRTAAEIAAEEVSTCPARRGGLAIVASGAAGIVAIDLAAKFRAQALVLYDCDAPLDQLRELSCHIVAHYA